MGDSAEKGKTDFSHGIRRKSQVFFFFNSRSLSALKKASFPLLKEVPSFLVAQDASLYLSL